MGYRINLYIKFHEHFSRLKAIIDERLFFSLNGFLFYNYQLLPYPSKDAPTKRLQNPILKSNSNMHSSLIKYILEILPSTFSKISGKSPILIKLPQSILK
jgi:hypothetical protein